MKIDTRSLEQRLNDLESTLMQRTGGHKATDDHQHDRRTAGTENRCSQANLNTVAGTKMTTNSILDIESNLGIMLIRADGTHRDYGFVREKMDWATQLKRIKSPLSFWKRLWHELKDKNVIPVGLGLAAFVEFLSTGNSHVAGPAVYALVTTVAVDYLATSMSGTGSMSVFNYIDSGTGTTAAAIGDTALQTPYGGARATGTQSVPTAGTYQTVGTITYSSGFAITEMGVFSSLTSGGSNVLWDHRVFAAVNVLNLDSISFTYQCQIVAGGS